MLKYPHECNFQISFEQSSEEIRGPFLESLGNLTGPKSCSEVKVSRKVGCVLTFIEVPFVSLANIFIV